MISIVISNNHMYEDLAYTLKSIRNTGAGFDMVEIKVLNFIEDSENKSELLSEFNSLNIEYIDAVKKQKMLAFSDCLNKLLGKYVLFANSGDIFSKSFFDVINRVDRRISKKKINANDANIIVVGTTPLENYENLASELKKSNKTLLHSDISVVNLTNNPEFVPRDTAGVIFNIDSIRKIGIDSSLLLDGLKNAMYQILNDNVSYVNVENQLIKSPYPLVTDKVNFSDVHNRYWYFESLENYLLPLLKKCRDKSGAKKFIQYTALNEIKWRYIYNQNADNKHVVDNDFDHFINICKEILLEIDNNIIFNSKNIPAYRMARGLYLALFNTKYGTNTKSEYLFDNKNILRKYEDIVLMKANLLKVILEVIEYEKDRLIFEASVDDFMDMSVCNLRCYLDGKEIELKETYRYAHTKFFGVSTNKRYTFNFEIPDEMITGDKQVLNFFIEYNGFSIQLPFTTRRYTSKLSTAVVYSYWKFKDEGNSLCFENSNYDLVLTKFKGRKRFVREILMLLRMLYGSQHSYKMFITRTAYWLTRPYFKNKKIWLTYDKLYKGGDCGEYFYKYMLSQNDGITPAYVINKGCEDAKRLKREGLKPLYFGTLKNQLYYLNADVVFATHGGVHSFNGIANSYVKYVADLIHADVTCIQHGLSVQQLAQELNRVYNNTKRYYCASKYEIKNLEHPIYGYEDKSVLRLTGIPRYDGLVSDDKKQILITPTWRAYISMPPVMGQSRPYYPEFKNTNYYKIYYKLLTDNKLIETARRTGYKLIYLLHPIISSQIVDYPDIDGVEIIPATTVNYEKILTESSLMLTDYSGVQFDFAYMRKPVVYYHPPKLPPHYKEGGFFYDSMGFGEICTEHQEMVDCLCDYMENNCEMKPFYKDRADDFFAYSDLESCKRIYDDMIEYQKIK